MRERAPAMAWLRSGIGSTARMSSLSVSAAMVPILSRSGELCCPFPAPVEIRP